MSALGGRVAKLGTLFTITQYQYLSWARSLPIESFVFTKPHTFDGDYLVLAGTGWVVYAQERGMKNWERTFTTEAEAHDFVLKTCSPYGIYEHLAAA